MKRYAITTTYQLEIEAEDEAEAWEKLVDHIDHGPFLSFHEVQSSTDEIKYTLAPAGAERWAKAAADCWFGSDRSEAGQYDGSWWWTNGHVALRCEGQAPDLQKLPDNAIQKSLDTEKARKKSGWSKAMSDRAHSFLRGRRAIESSDVIIQDKYYRLISDSIPGVCWMVGENYACPIHALDNEGRLVAVAMPVRADLPPIEASK